jgi:hypothetical protein
MSVLETLATALDVPLSELAAEAPVVAAVHEEPPGIRTHGEVAPTAVSRPPTPRALLDRRPGRTGEFVVLVLAAIPCISRDDTSQATSVATSARFHRQERRAWDSNPR